ASPKNGSSSSRADWASATGPCRSGSPLQPATRPGRRAQGLPLRCRSTGTVLHTRAGRWRRIGGLNPAPNAVRPSPNPGRPRCTWGPSRRQLVGPRRHRARHAMITLHQDRIGIAPNLTAIRQGQTAERVLLLFAVVVHEIDAPIEDGSAGVAVTHVNPPQLARLSRLPGSREAGGFRADGIPVWPTKLR